MHTEKKAANALKKMNYEGKSNLQKVFFLNCHISEWRQIKKNLPEGKKRKDFTSVRFSCLADVRFTLYLSEESGGEKNPL